MEESRGAVTEASTASWSDTRLDVAISSLLINREEKPVTLVQEILGVELSNAAEVIIELVAAKKLEVSNANVPLRRLLQSSQTEDVLAVGLDLLALHRQDIDLIGSMLNIRMTGPIEAMLKRVSSGMIDRSKAREPLMRLIKDAEIPRASSPVAEAAATEIPAMGTYSKEDSVVDTPGKQRPGIDIKDECPPHLPLMGTPRVTDTKVHQEEAGRLTTTPAGDPRRVPHYQNRSHDTKMALNPPSSLSLNPTAITGSMELRNRKREQFDESPFHPRDSKRVNTSKRDTNAAFQQMLKDIHKLVRRPPTSAERASVRVPDDVGNYRNVGYIHPYGPHHPDKSGHVTPSVYGANDDQDLGLRFATWCRKDRQCLFGKDCPWAHYLSHFCLQFIWRSGKNLEGYKFLQCAAESLQAGGQVPEPTGSPCEDRRRRL